MQNKTYYCYFRSKEVSEECRSRHTIVTYGLAIAKVAKQMKCDESLEYDEVSIMFGQFHIEGNIFSGIGKLLEGSGGPYLLSEARVVAMGSLNRFLKGKMYNRCRRSHSLLHCTP